MMNTSRVLKYVPLNPTKISASLSHSSPDAVYSSDGDHTMVTHSWIHSQTLWLQSTLTVV